MWKSILNLFRFYLLYCQIWLGLSLTLQLNAFWSWMKHCVRPLQWQRPHERFGVCLNTSGETRSAELTHKSYFYHTVMGLCHTLHKNRKAWILAHCLKFRVLSSQDWPVASSLLTSVKPWLLYQGRWWKPVIWLWNSLFVTV